MSIQPAFSHATQMITLARELQRRGHVVTVATSATFATTLIRHGVDARPIGVDWMLRPGDEIYERTVGQHKYFGFVQVSDRSLVEDLLRLARDTRAQLIVREYSEFGGWAVARSLVIPLVTQGITHRLPPPAEARIAELAQPLAALVDIEPPRDADELLGRAYLDVVPPSFRCAWEHDVPIGHASRPSLFDGSAGEMPPPWLDALGQDRPLIYATLGNIFTDSPVVWRAVLTALSGLDVDALVTTGLKTDPTDLGAPPPNVTICRYLPQSQLLPRCTAVVCHAGFNTLIGTFSNGLPALCLPLAADQPLNAICSAAAGAGINAAITPGHDPRSLLVDPDTLDPDDIAKAITRLITERAFTHAARQLSREIASMPGPTKTASIVEQLSSPRTHPRKLGDWLSLDVSPTSAEVVRDLVDLGSGPPVLSPRVSSTPPMLLLPRTAGISRWRRRRREAPASRLYGQRRSEVADALAGGPIRDACKRTRAVAPVGGAATSADPLVAAGWDELGNYLEVKPGFPSSRLRKSRSIQPPLASIEFGMCAICTSGSRPNAREGRFPSGRDAGARRRVASQKCCK